MLISPRLTGKALIREGPGGRPERRARAPAKRDRPAEGRPRPRLQYVSAPASRFGIASSCGLLCLGVALCLLHLRLPTACYTYALLSAKRDAVEVLGTGVGL